MSSDHVSVILPYFNRKDVLGDAIESVLNQSHRDLTLLLIDDGSDDGSHKLAGEFSDPRIVHAATCGRQGACAARNVGLELANSQLVAFQDSDDVWLPSKLASQIATLRAAQNRGLNVGVIGCGWTYLGQEAGGDFVFGPHSREDVLAGRVRGLGTPMLLVDRERLGRVSFDEGMPARQDQDFVLASLMGDDLVIVHEEILARVRRGRADHVARPSNSARAYERFLSKYEQELSDEPELSSWLHFRAARDFALLREIGGVRRNWAEARKHEPWKRAMHLCCGLLAGGKGLGAAARLWPLWDPRLSAVKPNSASAEMGTGDPTLP